jgi:tetratricopeptide (TPR) repeat protein
VRRLSESEPLHQLRQGGRADRGGIVNQAGRDIIIHGGIERPDYSPAIPFQLPRDIHDFTGRQGALQKLQELFSDNSMDVKAIIITAIAGKGGVGKTTLAVRYAHLLRERFPDGQLYVNLRGVEAERLEPADVLAEFLRTLGIRGSEIPQSIDARERLYRTLLSQRRILVILDNVANEAQVRPLLPGSSTCAVLITGRSRLAALESAYVLTLDVMEPDESRDFLVKILGASRVAAEPEAASTIVRLCGYLPLAVRIAGARLAARETWRLAKLADRLVDERRRLDELRIGDLEVRASFGLSYQNLSPQHQRAFRLLGMLKMPDFTALSGALLLGSKITVAEDIIAHLFDACLLEIVGDDHVGQTRYQFHDLLRVFARERLAQDEESSEQNAALDRLLSGYLVIVERGTAALQGKPHQVSDSTTEIAVLVDEAGLADVIDREPLAWFATERLNLVALVEHAYEASRFKETTALTEILVDFFDARAHWSDWEYTHELALKSAQQMVDLATEASLLRSTGRLYRYRRPFDAISCLNRSLPILRRLGDRPGEAAALLDLGLISREQGRLREAVNHYELCLSIHRELGDLRGEGAVLRSLGFVYRDLGRFTEAISTYEQCLDVFRAPSDSRWEAYAFRGLALVHRGLGHVDDALACYEQALPIFRDLGDRRGEAYVFYDLGSLRTDQGYLEDALKWFDLCLPIMRELRDQRGEAYAIMELGLTYLRLGRPTDARACFEQCLTALRDLGDVRGEAWGLLYLADLCRSENRIDEALGLYRRCQLVFGDRSDAVGEARALEGLGTALHVNGQDEQARSILENALARFEEMGMPEAARVRTYLGTFT